MAEFEVGTVRMLGGWRLRLWVWHDRVRMWWQLHRYFTRAERWKLRRIECIIEEATDRLMLGEPPA